ncbi:MAG: glutathione peroxidase [Candidatus Sericytochromatia bacterium]|nr:glutathione peroxidase [Candidatus Sericytochromatia bacterium]
MNANIHDIPLRTLKGEDTTLAAWQGKVLLIVNVASKCGFTPQYKGLEELWRKYADKGLVVLGFPCNQFGAQEPGDAEEIANFCSLTYDVSFPMFAKVDVNGDNAHPLFQHLKRAQKGILGTEGIKWNFTKFLVGRDGQVIDRYASATTPADLEQAIEKALAA